MAKTFKTLIQDAMPWIGLSADPIQTDIRDVALSILNAEGKTIHDRWPWDNSKIPQFTIEVGTDGLVTFDATVDVIRAVRQVESTHIGGGYPIFSEDEVTASIQGGQVSSMSFQHMADSEDGYRQILLNPDMEGNLIGILALNRFVEATSATYDSVVFSIDKAETALFWELVDGLRGFVGMEPMKKGEKSFSIASTREEKFNQKESRLIPRYPMFDQEND